MSIFMPQILMQTNDLSFKNISLNDFQMSTLTAAWNIYRNVDSCIPILIVNIMTVVETENIHSFLAIVFH